MEQSPRSVNDSIPRTSASKISGVGRPVAMSSRISACQPKQALSPLPLGDVPDDAKHLSVREPDVTGLADPEPLVDLEPVLQRIGAAALVGGPDGGQHLRGEARRSEIRDTPPDQLLPPVGGLDALRRETVQEGAAGADAVGDVREQLQQRLAQPLALELEPDAGLALRDQRAEHQGHGDQGELEDLNGGVSLLERDREEGTHSMRRCQGHHQRRQGGTRRGSARTEAHPRVECHREHQEEPDDPGGAGRDQLHGPPQQADDRHDDRSRLGDGPEPKPGHRRRHPGEHHRNHRQHAEGVHPPPAIPAGVEGRPPLGHRHLTRKPGEQHAADRCHRRRDEECQRVAQSAQARAEAKVPEHQHAGDCLRGAADRRGQRGGKVVRRQQALRHRTQHHHPPALQPQQPEPADRDPGRQPEDGLIHRPGPAGEHVGRRQVDQEQERGSAVPSKRPGHTPNSRQGSRKARGGSTDRPGRSRADRCDGRTSLRAPDGPPVCSPAHRPGRARRRSAAAHG